MRASSRLLLLGLLLLLPCACAEGHRTVETTNEQEAWLQAAFDKHVIRITPVGRSARFVTDGFFLAGTNSDFTLSEGHEFQIRPDDHAATTFRIEKIQPAGITIAYTSSFNHASFGQNLTTIDRGILEPRWRD